MSIPPVDGYVMVLQPEEPKISLSGVHHFARAASDFESSEGVFLFPELRIISTITREVEPDGEGDEDPTGDKRPLLQGQSPVAQNWVVETLLPPFGPLPQGIGAPWGLRGCSWACFWVCRSPELVLPHGHTPGGSFHFSGLTSAPDPALRPRGRALLWECCHCPAPAGEPPGGQGAPVLRPAWGPVLLGTCSPLS